MTAYTRESSPSITPMTLIAPSTGWVPLRLGELWRYRELLYFFVWRNIKVRYRQTLLGVAWAAIQPLVLMVVFSVFLGRLAKVPSDGVPYPIFSFSALVPWGLFAHSLSSASNSLLDSANLLRKVYFPRLIMPLAAALTGLVDFVVALLVLVGMMTYYGVPLSPRVLALPFFVLLALVSALGVAFWLSALNVHYRDVRNGLPFLTQFWFFATPVAYPSSLLSEPWRTIYSLNPMVGVVEGFRWALLKTDTAPGLTVLASSLMALLVLVTGAFYFRRMEKYFADRV